MSQPKWYKSDRDSNVGDVVLFLKSEKIRQAIPIRHCYRSTGKQGGKIGEIEVEYQKHNENIKQCTIRGVREIMVIHPVDELDMHQLSTLPH